MAENPREHLKAYLSDIYSIEEQALAQLRDAPGVVGDGQLSFHHRQHRIETERQADMVKDRLEALGGSPSKIKDAVMKVGGKGFLHFAGAQPDTPGKLAAHSFSYEALEVAAYELLTKVARRADDADTARVASTIQRQERAMMERLAEDFDEAVDASLNALGKTASEALPSYLADAHALEAQAIKLLEKGSDIAGDPELARIYDDHRRESTEHSRLLEQQLSALGAKPSAVNDTALKAGAINWAMFFQMLDDTPAKLAAFVYAFEHLEIAGYELLKRVADKAGDTTSADLAERIVIEERAMAKRIFGELDRALAASMAASI